MRLLLLFIVVLSIIIIASSCARSQQDNDIKYIKREYEAFVYLKKLLHIETYDTHIIIEHSFASGICVKSEKYHSYRTILTVEHFCKDKKLELNKFIEEFSEAYKIASAMIKNYNNKIQLTAKKIQHNNNTTIIPKIQTPPEIPLLFKYLILRLSSKFFLLSSPYHKICF